MIIEKFNRSLLLLAVLFFVGPFALGQDGSGEHETAVDTVADSTTDRDLLKRAILEKNIFRPARRRTAVQPVQTAVPPLSDLVPKPLKRPFLLLGIRQTAEEAVASVYFESPAPEIRPVRVGDDIETIRILAIESSYLLCDYSGSQVRIGVGQTSSDALRSLRGYGVEYELLGTTVDQTGAFASIKLRGEDSPIRVEVGDLLGDEQVVDISPGKLYLRDEDGTVRFIEPTSRADLP